MKTMYSTRRKGSELAINISYPTNASGNNCFIKNALKI